MSEELPQNFPLNMDTLKEMLFNKLTKMKLSGFHEVICKRAKPVWRVPQVTLALQRFLRDRYASKHAKTWAIYKLMLTFDLFNIGELLYLDSMALQQHIDRLYGVMHWTNDNPSEMAKELLEQKYYGTSVESELASLLGTHCQIKDDSLIKLLPLHRQTLRLYDQTKNFIDRLQVQLLKQHIRQGFTPGMIENSEAKFIKVYFNSSDEFKKQGGCYIILLEAEDAGNKIIKQYEEAKLADSDNDGFPNEESRVQAMQRTYNKAMGELQLVLKTLWENAFALNEYSQFTKLTSIAQQIKLTSQNEFLQFMELLKFNVAKVLFYECIIRQHEFTVYRSLTNIKLIQDRSLVVLWKRFHQEITLLLSLLEKGSFVAIGEFRMQKLNKISSKDDFKKDFAINLPFEAPVADCVNNIKMIFDEVDLMMVSWVCQNWVRATQLKESTRTLLIGKTKAGKSSLLNFLTGSNSEKVGESLLSGTFFPSKVMIQPPPGVQKQNQQAWDLPGLQDTNGKIFKLCVGYFLHTLTVKSQIKVWYLMNNYLFMNNRNDYAGFVMFLGQLLQWDPINVSCMTFVFSYAAESTEKKAEKEFKRFFEKNLAKKPNEEYEQIHKYIKEQGVGDNRHVQFEIAVRGRLEKAHTFFYKNDIVKNGGNQQDPDSDSSSDVKSREHSRMKLLMRMHELKSKNDDYPLEPSNTIKIKVDPLTFVKEEKSFFMSFKITQKCGKYLALDQPIIEDEMFLKLYRSIRSFMTIREAQIIFEYKKHRAVLQKQYQRIQTKFKDLNSIVEKLKKEDIKHPFLPLLESWLDIFFDWSEGEDQAKKTRDIRKLRDYLLRMMYRMQGGIKSILGSASDDDIRDAMMELHDVKEFKYKVPIDELQSSKWLLVATEGIDAEHNLLQLLTELWSSNSYSEVQMLSIEHYLILNSQNNERSGINLNNKMKLLDIKEIENGLQLLRLNCHGQGIYEELKFGQFLHMNAIVEGDYCLLSQPQPIRIFCNKIIFDRESFVIRVVHSLSIVARIFEVDCHSCMLDVKKIGDGVKTQAATIIVKSFDTPPEEQAKLIIKPNIQQEDLNIATKEINNEQKNTRIQRIIERGRVISRTANDDGTYAEKIIYEPPISYIHDKIKTKNNAYVILMDSPSANKLMQFGSLHLANKVIQELRNRNVRMLETPGQFRKRCRQACSKAIDHILQSFSKTTIRLSEEHFDDSLCSKLQRAIVPYFVPSKPISEKDMLKDSYLIVRQVILNDTFARINRSLREMYQQQGGLNKYSIAKKLQDDQRMIKIFCDTLLTQPMENVAENSTNHHMMRFANLFNREFQKKALVTITKFEVKRVFRAVFRWFSSTATLLDNLRKFDKDEAYAQRSIEELHNEYRRAMNILWEKKQSTPPHTDNADSNTHSRLHDSETSKTTAPTRAVDLILEYFNTRKYRRAVVKYEEAIVAKSETLEDSVLLKIAYSYIKLNEFPKARDVLNSVSHQNDGREYTRIKRMLTTLQVKYESFFLRTERDPPDNLLKIYEKETNDYLVQPFSPEQIQQSTIRFEQRCDSRAQSTLNILSMDSGSNGNGIVNVLLAAQLEKLTHRPILHMFDMICGKNESAFVASALSIHKRGEKMDHFESSFKPQFEAYQLIASYPETLKVLDRLLEMKKQRYRELYMKDLIIQLALVIDSGRPQCFASFEKKRHRDTIYDIMMNAVGEGRDRNTLPNPIYTVWEDFRKTSTYRNYEHFNILSFGTGINERLREHDKIRLEAPEKTYTVERWQLYFDDSINLEEESELSYWDQTRIFMEEKWLGEKWLGEKNAQSPNNLEDETKKMRKLIDQLEDRPFIERKNKGKWQW